MPVSKKGAPVWNYTSQKNALEVASFTFNGLCATHIYKNNSWTAATNYNKGEHNKANEERTELATGVSERNKANNIYDFAGNINEWSTETGKHNASNTTYAVLRGGGFHHEGNKQAASYRSGSDSAIFANILYGFRVVLYLE